MSDTIAAQYKTAIKGKQWGAREHARQSINHSQPVKNGICIRQYEMQ